MAGPTSTAARDIVLEIEDDTDLKLEIKNQMELTADEIEDTDEIKKKKHMARNALTLWQEKLKNLGEARCQLRLAISSSLSEVYQLGSLYSVFAGVVLTAVATSPRLQCQHLWSPVGLCLFTYCIIVTITYKKFRHISKLERIKDDVKQESRGIVSKLNALKINGYQDFDFGRKGNQNIRQVKHHHSYRRSLIVIPPLTIFTAGLMGSFTHILCKS
ncbi:hypothetical protein M758_11G106300 [Ceratodon purpureus]|nr:hypothetical protein M758_11G106300 [Ceratodon purpureus]